MYLYLLIINYSLDGNKSDRQTFWFQISDRRTGNDYEGPLSALLDLASLELNLSLLEVNSESSVRGVVGICRAYPHAECGDLQYALDSEHPREAHVHVLQRVLVRVALPMELQCIHWQTHGRQTNIRTYKLIKPRGLAWTKSFIRSLIWTILFHPPTVALRRGKKRIYFFFTPKTLCTDTWTFCAAIENGVNLASTGLTLHWDWTSVWSSLRSFISIDSVNKIYWTIFFLPYVIVKNCRNSK